MIIKDISNIINTEQPENTNKNYLHNKKDNTRPFTAGMYERYRRFKLLCKLIKVILTQDIKK